MDLVHFFQAAQQLNESMMKSSNVEVLLEMAREQVAHHS